MRRGVQQVVVKRSRGAVVVQAIGRTARGVRFIIEEEEIADRKTTDKNFKAQVTAATDKLLASEA